MKGVFVPDEHQDTIWTAEKEKAFKELFGFDVIKARGVPICITEGPGVGDCMIDTLSRLGVNVSRMMPLNDGRMFIRNVN